MPHSPNILYVFADEWRRQAAGFMGEDPVLTPCIDRFAEQTVVFTEAISSYPLCTPHRAALLTGRHAAATGVVTNCMPGCPIALGEHEVCIGDVLRSAGYATGYIGKWHLDEPSVNHSPAPADEATDWDGFTPPGPRRHGCDFWYAYNCDHDHLASHYWRDSPTPIRVHQWSPEHETDVAIDFIRRRAAGPARPFALFVSWNPPHMAEGLSFNALPEKYRAIYRSRPTPARANVRLDDTPDVARFRAYHRGQPWEHHGAALAEHARPDYFAAVTGLNENFARLLACLDDQGLTDNTILVLSSDHGEMMGSHNLMYKHVWFEESIGIPLLVRWPAALRPRRDDLLLGSADHMPTLLGLAGLPIPPAVQGADYSPALHGHPMPRPDQVVICQYPWSLGVDWRTAGWRGLRTARHTYVVDRGHAGGEPMRFLHDNLRDPLQMAPAIAALASEHPLMADLDRRLRAQLASIGDPFPLD